ncbi:MAG: HlyD family efflux transporter periplasmic adaptor subunit [Leptolinea sp.]|jgi:multidrug resistance efflux pump|nr:HlyD family efflux transporter periplasmic adaptor subunit [Leptolinea sp.]
MINFREATRPSSINSRIYTCLIPLVLSGLLTGCGILSQATPTPQTPMQTGAGAAAEARVIPIRSSMLSFAATGKVESIEAVEGAAVKKGDPIARLNGAEQATAAITAAELQVTSAQKALDDLNEKAKLAAADAEMAVAIAAQELKDAKEHRDDLNYKRVNQYMLEGIQAQLIVAEQAVDDAETAFSYVQDRPEDDADRAKALAYLSQARLARDQIKRNLEYAEGPPAAQDIAEADARVSKAEAALEDARRKYERRKRGPDPKDLALAEANVKNAKAQADSARAALADLELTAPFDGTIIVNNLEVGELASAGQVMIGDTSKWQVETTDLKEVDIVGIQSGLPVKVRFDAIPDLEITGVVNRVKGYGITVRGDNTYVVTVDLQQSDPRLLWNMTARVTFPVIRSTQETKNP